ncbi:hypothetical protein GCM10020229_51500 [Kitasatospora albolonga]
MQQGGGEALLAVVPVPVAVAELGPLRYQAAVTARQDLGPALVGGPAELAGRAEGPPSKADSVTPVRRTAILAGCRTGSLTA